MKRKLIITMCVLLTATIGITYAQSMNNDDGRTEAEIRADLQTKKMTDIYNLTGAQQEVIYEANLDYQTKFLALRGEKNAEESDGSKELLLKEAHGQKVLTVLSAEQKADWDKHIDYRKVNPAPEKK